MLALNLKEVRFVLTRIDHFRVPPYLAYYGAMSGNQTMLQASCKHLSFIGYTLSSSAK